MIFKKTVILIGVLFLVVISATIPVAATVSIDTEAEYSGGEEGQTQAVKISYTLSPEENDINDVRIRISETDSSFVDFDSFKRSVNPGDADVQIETVEEGVFRIDELKPGQEITLTFEAYPRDIQQRELQMSVVAVEYVQQGQSLEESTVITADLSNSPWFQLQDAQDNNDNSNGGSGLGLILGILVGVLLGAGGAYYGLEIL